MKIIRQRQTSKGTVIMTVEIGFDYALLEFDPTAKYEMGYPLQDVVSGQEIMEAKRVEWCSVEQRWLS